MVQREVKHNYLITIGSELYSARFVSSIKDKFGFKDSYEEQCIYRALKKRGFWARLDGSLIIRRVPWIDYLPTNVKKDDT